MSYRSRRLFGNGLPATAQYGRAGPPRSLDGGRAAGVQWTRVDSPFERLLDQPVEEPSALHFVANTGITGGHRFLGP